MKKSKDSFMVCPICKRPIVMYRLRGPNYKHRMVQSQGPKKNPKIKKWCLNNCEGLLLDIQIVVNELAKRQSPKMQEWAKDMLTDIESTYEKFISDLIKNKNVR